MSPHGVIGCIFHLFKAEKLSKNGAWGVFVNLSLIRQISQKCGPNLGRLNDNSKRKIRAYFAIYNPLFSKAVIRMLCSDWSGVETVN